MVVDNLLNVNDDILRSLLFRIDTNIPIMTRWIHVCVNSVHNVWLQHYIIQRSNGPIKVLNLIIIINRNFNFSVLWNFLFSWLDDWLSISLFVFDLSYLIMTVELTIDDVNWHHECDRVLKFWIEIWLLVSNLSYFCFHVLVSNSMMDNMFHIFDKLIF